MPLSLIERGFRGAPTYSGHPGPSSADSLCGLAQAAIWRCPQRGRRGATALRGSSVLTRCCTQATGARSHWSPTCRRRRRRLPGRGTWSSTPGGAPCRRPCSRGLSTRFPAGLCLQAPPGLMRWDKLLAGRSAELLVTMDTPPWYYRWVQRGQATTRCKRPSWVQWHPARARARVEPVHSATAQRKQLAGAEHENWGRS